MSQHFSASYPVRFGEIDHAGVMYYPSIFDRIHRAFEDFWPAVLGRSYAEVLETDGIGFPLVDVQASFRRPFRFGDQIEVGIAVARIGKTSLHFEVRLAGPGEDRPRATAVLVNAVISMETFKPMELPTSYVEALRPYLSPGGASE